MNLAGKPLTRGPLVDRPRQRPAYLIDARPIDTPWEPYPAHAMPAADVANHCHMTMRGHRFTKGRCEFCGTRRPRRGGVDVVCPGAKPCR